MLTFSALPCCFQDDLYAFPPLEVCFWEGTGCDENLHESTCVASAGTTVYDPCFNATEDIQFTSQVSASRMSFRCVSRVNDALPLFLGGLFLPLDLNAGFARLIRSLQDACQGSSYSSQKFKATSSKSTHMYGVMWYYNCSP